MLPWFARLCCEICKVRSPLIIIGIWISFEVLVQLCGDSLIICILKLDQNGQFESKVNTFFSNIRQTLLPRRSIPWCWLLWQDICPLQYFSLHIIPSTTFNAYFTTFERDNSLFSLQLHTSIEKYHLCKWRHLALISCWTGSIFFIQGHSSEHRGQGSLTTVCNQLNYS